MTVVHDLRCTSGPGGLLFECEQGCGRRLVVDAVRGDLVVIDKGDPYAEHRGRTEGLELGRPEVAQR